MSDRLRSFIQSTGLNDSEFAKKIGATRQQVSDWKNGRAIPLGRISDMIDCFPEFNSHWLLSGQGNMVSGLEKTGEGEAINCCLDPVCIQEREHLKQKIDELKEQIIQIQRENIECLKLQREGIPK